MRTTNQKLPALLAGMTVLVISAGATVATAQDDVQGAGSSAQQTVRDQSAATGELDRQRNDAATQDDSASGQSQEEQDRRAREAAATTLEETSAATRSVPPAHATRMPEQTAANPAGSAGNDEISQTSSHDEAESSASSSTAATDDESVTNATKSIPPAHATRMPAPRSTASTASSDNPREESSVMSSAEHSSANDESTSTEAATSGRIATSESADATSPEESSAVRSVPPAHATRMARQGTGSTGNDLDRQTDTSGPERQRRVDANDETTPDEHGYAAESRSATNSPDETATTRSIPPAHATRMPPPKATNSSTVATQGAADESNAPAEETSSSNASGVVSSRASEEPAPGSDATTRAGQGTTRESMPSSSNTVIARDHDRHGNYGNDRSAASENESEADREDSSRGMASEASNDEGTRSVPPAHATRMPVDVDRGSSATAMDESARESTSQDRSRSSSTLATRDRSHDETNLHGSTDRGANAATGGMTASIVAKFEALDSNHDGLIDATEAAASEGLSAQFSALDNDGDGTLSLSEFGAASNLASIRRDRQDEQQQ